MVDQLPDIFAGAPDAKPRAKARKPASKDRGTWRSIGSFVEGQGFEFSGGGDTKGHNPGSKHYTGEAVDVRTRGRNPADVDAFIAKAKAAGYHVNDERIDPRPNNPGQIWTAEHVHVSLPDVPNIFSDAPDAPAPLKRIADPGYRSAAPLPVAAPTSKVSQKPKQKGVAALLGRLTDPGYRSLPRGNEFGPVPKGSRTTSPEEIDAAIARERFANVGTGDLVKAAIAGPAVGPKQGRSERYQQVLDELHNRATNLGTTVGEMTGGKVGKFVGGHGAGFVSGAATSIPQSFASAGKASSGEDLTLQDRLAIGALGLGALAPGSSWSFGALPKGAIEAGVGRVAKGVASKIGAKVPKAGKVEPIAPGVEFRSPKGSKGAKFDTDLPLSSEVGHPVAAPIPPAAHPIADPLPPARAPEGGRTMYREVHPSALLTGDYRQPGTFWTDNPDLALGQGENRGIVIEYAIPDSVQLTENVKPGTQVPGVGKEYQLGPSTLTGQGLKSVTVRAGAVLPKEVETHFRHFSDEGFPNRIYTKETLPNGDVKYTRMRAGSTSPEVPVTPPVPATPRAQAEVPVGSGASVSRETFNGDLRTIADGDTVTLDPDRIQVHPSMQSREGANARGVVADNRIGGDTFLKDQQGPMTVWIDHDGTAYIGDGHHRLELAQEAKRFGVRSVGNTVADTPRGVDVIVRQAKDGWTIEDAASEAAMRNMAAGTIKPSEAVSALRRYRLTVEDVVKTGVSLKPKQAATIDGLLSLPDELFRGFVKTGHVPEDVAAGVGSLDLTRAEAESALRSVERNGKLRTFQEGVDVARSVKRHGARLDQGGFEGLEDVLAHADAEYAQVVAAVRARLGKTISEALKPVDARLLEGEVIDKTARRGFVDAMGGSGKQAKGRLDFALDHDAELNQKFWDAAGDVQDGKLTVEEAARKLETDAKEAAGKGLDELVNSKRGGEAPSDRSVAQEPASQPAEVTPRQKRIDQQAGMVQEWAKEGVSGEDALARLLKMGATRDEAEAAIIKSGQVFREKYSEPPTGDMFDPQTDDLFGSDVAALREAATPKVGGIPRPGGGKKSGAISMDAVDILAGMLTRNARPKATGSIKSAAVSIFGNTFDRLKTLGEHGVQVAKELTKVVLDAERMTATWGFRLKESVKANYGRFAEVSKSGKQALGKTDQFTDIVSKVQRGDKLTKQEGAVWSEWVNINKDILAAGRKFKIHSERIVGDTLPIDKLKGVNAEWWVNGRKQSGRITGETADGITVATENGPVTMEAGQVFATEQLANPETYFPHQLKPGILEKLLDEDSPTYKQLVDHLLAKNAARTEAEAKAIIRRQMNPSVVETTGPSKSRLRMERSGVLMPDEFYDRDFLKVGERHIASSSLDIAAARIWGAQSEGLAETLGKMPSGGYARSAANLVEQALGKHPQQAVDAWGRKAASVEGAYTAVTKLTSIATAIRQLPQTVSAGARLGWVNHVKATSALAKDLITGRKQIDAVKLSGVVDQDVLSLQGFDDIGGKIRGVTSAALTAVRVADRVSRVHAAILGKIAFADAVKGLKMSKGGVLVDNAAYRLLESHYDFTKADIARFAAGEKVTRADMVQAMAGGVKTQVTTRPFDLPAIASTPAGKLLFRLQTFNYGQTRIVNGLVTEAARGNVVPLLRMAIGAGVVGEVSADLIDEVKRRMQGQGDKPSRFEELSEIDTWEGLGGRVLNNILETGSLGLYSIPFEKTIKSWRELPFPPLGRSVMNAFDSITYAAKSEADFLGKLQAAGMNFSQKEIVLLKQYYQFHHEGKTYRQENPLPKSSKGSKSKVVPRAPY